MEILLTESEIDAVLDDWGKNPAGRKYDIEVASAQLKKVAEWLEGEPCNASALRWKEHILKALLKEAED